MHTEPQYRVLLPVADLDELRLLLPVAGALALDRQGQLVVVHIVAVPEDRSLSEATAEASRSRQAIDSFLATNGYTAVPVRTTVRVAREVWNGIWEAVEEEGADMLVLGWRGDGLTKSAVEQPMHERLTAPPCSVVVVRPDAAMAGAADWTTLRRILLPVRGGPHASLTLRVANALAELAAADVTLLHVTGQAPRDAEEQLFAAFGPAVRGLKQLSRAVTTVGDVTRAIVEEAAAHQAVVMGAPARRVGPDGWSGPVLEAVAAECDKTLIVVKERLPATPAEAEEDALKWPDRPIAVVVDKWFAENTFRSAEFADLERLVMLKEAQGLTISLGLPALNEEETVGNVIRTIQQALLEEVPLLDEIVLIDSDSTDATREIAADLGVPVYIHQQILPRYGAYQGKGEALWLSLIHI